MCAFFWAEVEATTMLANRGHSGNRARRPLGCRHIRLPARRADTNGVASFHPVSRARSAPCARAAYQHIRKLDTANSPRAPNCALHWCPMLHEMSSGSAPWALRRLIDTHRQTACSKKWRITNGDVIGDHWVMSELTFYSDSACNQSLAPCST